MPKQRVVVRHRHGVELVIVAAGAGHGRRLKGLGQGVDLVVGQIVADLPQADAIVVIRLAKTIEGGADHRLVEALSLIDALLRQQIAGDVLAHKLVVRHVVVEGADQVVAVAPGVVYLVIPLVAVRFRESHHIHPVPGQALAEMRRSQQ